MDEVVMDLGCRTYGVLRVDHSYVCTMRMKSGAEFVLEEHDDALLQMYTASLKLPDGRSLRFVPGPFTSTPNLSELARETYPGSRFTLGDTEILLTVGEPLKPQLERKDARAFRDLLPPEYVELAELLEDAGRALIAGGHNPGGFGNVFIALPLGRDPNLESGAKRGYELREIDSKVRRLEKGELDKLVRERNAKSAATLEKQQENELAKPETTKPEATKPEGPASRLAP